MKKYKYNIVNLDCANCAREIEEALNKNEYLNNVVVNFNTLTLSYESEKEFSLKELNALVKKIEPDTSITSNEIAVKKRISFIHINTWHHHRGTSPIPKHPPKPKNHSIHNIL